MTLFASDLTRDLDFPEHSAVITVRALTWIEDETARNKGETAAYTRFPAGVIEKVFERDGPKDAEAREAARAEALANPAYDRNEVLGAGITRIVVDGRAAKRDAYKQLTGGVATACFDAIIALTNSGDSDPESSEA